MSVALLLSLCLLAHVTLAKRPPRFCKYPIALISTIDGTLSGFDGMTGSPLFTYHDKRPLITSWAAPGIPDYIPSVDGFLYRINSSTDQAHVIHGDFGGGETAVPVTAADHGEAVIHMSHDSSILLIHLRSGRVIPMSDISESNMPWLGKYVIPVRRTSVVASAVEAATKRQLANASFIHTIPYISCNDVCPTPSDSHIDSVHVYISVSRDKLFVKSTQVQKTLWSREVSSSIVWAFSPAGVRIASPPKGELMVEASVSPECGTHVLVAEEGRTKYAMPIAPGNSTSTCNAGLGSGIRKRKVKKYNITNVANTTALRDIDRPFVINTPPLYPHRFASSSGKNRGRPVIVRLCLLALKYALPFAGYSLGCHFVDTCRYRFERLLDE